MPSPTQYSRDRLEPSPKGEAVMDRGLVVIRMFLNKQQSHHYVCYRAVYKAWVCKDVAANEVRKVRMKSTRSNSARVTGLLPNTFLFDRE